MRRLSLIGIIVWVSLLTGGMPAYAEEYEYTVKDATETVSLISLRHYGTFNYWREIALLNRLSSAQVLEPGQTLKLPRAPILDPREGAALVVEYWRGRGGARRSRSRAAPAPSVASTPRKEERFETGPAVGSDYPAMEPGEPIRPPSKIGPKRAEPAVKESDL